MSARSTHRKWLAALAGLALAATGWAQAPAPADPKETPPAQVLSPPQRPAAERPPRIQGAHTVDVIAPGEKVETVIDKLQLQRDRAPLDRAPPDRGAPPGATPPGGPRLRGGGERRPGPPGRIPGPREGPRRGDGAPHHGPEGPRQPPLAPRP